MQDTPKAAASKPERGSPEEVAESLRRFRHAHCARLAADLRDTLETLAVWGVHLDVVPSRRKVAA